MKVIALDRTTGKEITYSSKEFFALLNPRNQNQTNIFQIGGNYMSIVEYIESKGSLTLLPFGSVINYTPLAGDNIIRFDPIMNTDVTFNINSINSTLGDKLILTLLVDPLALSAKLNFDSNFYFTLCGGVQTQLDLTGFERWVIEFFYDGQKFVNTNDNC